MGQVLSIEKMHNVARERFRTNPGKCYQRHIRELYAEGEGREPVASVNGARVERVSREEARALILKYEWLATMARGTRACYGLKSHGELLGVACFASMGGPIRNICGPEHADKSICLARGACVPHAPKNAASFLVRWACHQAYRDFGWQVFFAYSDADAGEIGTIYQAVGWHYHGSGLGRGEESFHVDWKSPDSTRTKTSNVLNHDTEKLFFRSLGWDETKGDPHRYLVFLGWTPIRRPGKKKWVWFEGTAEERAKLKARCRYPFLPYPKRTVEPCVEEGA
jgi:hypothetical protein